MSVFDNLGVSGKLAIPSFLKFQTCEKANSSLTDTDLRTEAARVFFHDTRSFSDRDSVLTREALNDPRVACCS
jgi:hypothetical protein